MTKSKLNLKVVLPIIIIVAAVAVTALLIILKPVPQRAARSYSGPLAEVMPVQMTSRQIVVSGTGTVQSTQEAEITPQVSGRIVYAASRMAAGGFFKKGETLFTIEKVDYELALERAKASLAQAELELLKSESLAEIARLEWQRVENGSDRSANPLTLYEPQLKTAQAQVASASSAVRQAELDLKRTVVRAPFNCFVRSEKVDLGQYVRAGTAVATVAGTDAVEIVVPLQLEELDWLQVPRSGAKGPGSAATVRLQVGSEQSEWRGTIVRTHGEIDPRSRMARVVVAVRDPFGQADKGATGRELAPGMFVEVLFHGQKLDDIFTLPRSAVRDHDTVWLVDDNNKLKIVAVDVVRRERDEVLIRAGLKPGDRVVMTGLAAAADGMLIRPQQKEPKQ